MYEKSLLRRVTANIHLWMPTCQNKSYIKVLMDDYAVLICEPAPGPPVPWHGRIDLLLIVQAASVDIGIGGTDK